MSSFKKTVKQIANAEKNADKVLKAARLQRCPKQGISEETIIAMLVMVCAFGMFALLVLFG